MYKYGLIDGNHMLHRMMHVPALQDLIYVDEDANAYLAGPTFGFLKSLRYTLDKFGIDIAILTWDRGHSTRRKEILPTYKDRGEPDEESKAYFAFFQQQRQMIDTILPLLGVRQIYKEGREADDLICQIAKTESALGQEIVIISEDSDFLQLVDVGVSLFRPICEKYYHIDTIQEETGMTPYQHLWCKAISGDSSDAISGIPGVGGGTATKIAKEIHTELRPFIGKDKQAEAILSSIIVELDNWRSNKVLDHMDIVMRNFKLIDLTLEDFSHPELASMAWVAYSEAKKFMANKDKHKAYGLLKAWNMGSILNNYENWHLPFRRLR